MAINKLSKVLPALIITLFLFSCGKVRRDQIYFNNLPDTLKSIKVESSPYVEPVIQTNDVLSVIIQTVDPTNQVLVNQVTPTSVMASSSGTGVSQTVSGFLVDKAGNIKLPWLGELKVAGLTITQARSMVDENARKYFTQPNVQVNFATYKVTVIGEVLRPATYNIPFEKVTVFDAIGIAGDITIYGRKDNVLLVRDSIGQKRLVRLNLNSSDVFKSPYYHLKQNDIIYIEANKDKIATSESYKTRSVTITVTLLSAFVVLLSRFIK